VAAVLPNKQTYIFVQT